MSRLRVEVSHNGMVVPLARSGPGQEIEWKKVPPTKWTAVFNHPDIFEGFCIRHFDSAAARKEFIKEVRECS